MPVFFSFEQVREDVAKYAADLSHEQLWREFQGASVGFHLKHLAGSVDRLTTYLIGRSPEDAILKADEGVGRGRGRPPHRTSSSPSVARRAMWYSLSDEQLLALKEEHSGSSDGRQLAEEVEAALDESESRLRDIDPQTLYEPRYVGRKRLPTTVLGLIVHLAEHTQRHLGQGITLAKMLRPPPLQ